MNILTSKELLKVQTINVGELTDVVRQVVWKVSFCDEENPETVKSVAKVVTTLDVDNLDPNTYIEFSAVTQQNILNWAEAQQGGDIFMDNLKMGHMDHLTSQREELSFQEKDVLLIAKA